MSQLVCVKCQCAMRPETNDTTVIEMASFGPCRVWSADVWKCPGGGVEIVSGFGKNPIRDDHYADDFKDWLEKYISISRRVVYNYENPISSLELTLDCLE